MYCRYWADIDTELRRSAFERKIQVRLLISCWGSTSPDTFPFLRSLASLQDSKPKLDVQVVSKIRDACEAEVSSSDLKGESWVAFVS